MEEAHTVRLPGCPAAMRLWSATVAPMDSTRTAAIYTRQSRDKARSMDEQEGDCRTVCERESWPVTEVYSDGVSASRYARRGRPDWERLLADLAAGRFGVLVLWESSRGDRKLATWAAMLDLCREHGVWIHVVTHGRTLDMANERDYRTLAEDGVDSAYESGKTSARVGRNMARAAADGKPHGPAPYGYQRIYDPVTRALTAQAPHPDQAPVVREIIERAGAGVPLIEITRDLTARGVPAPGGGAVWHRSRVRAIATSVAYIGQRQHGAAVHAGTWEALVTEKVFYAAQRVLSDPARKTTRPGRTKHLLSYLADCGMCGARLHISHRRGVPHYACGGSGCTSIKGSWLDEFAGRLIVARLAAPDFYGGWLAYRAEDDSAVVSARAEAQTLRTRLDGFYDAGARGELSPAALTRVEAQLLPEITAAERRAQRAGIPPALHALLEPGADLAACWAATPRPAQKDILRLMFARIALSAPTRRGGAGEDFDVDRVVIEWN